MAPDILADYFSGLSAKEIGAKRGISAKTASRFCKPALEAIDAGLLEPLIQPGRKK
jgi:hypothetical protein